jgi:hypothetical protein
LAFGTAITLFCFSACRLKNTEISHEQVIFEPSELDLGHLVEGQSKEATLWLRNSSRETVHIDSIQSGCACTGAHSDASEILPGQKIPVVVEMKNDKRRNFFHAGIGVKWSTSTLKGESTAIVQAFADQVADFDPAEVDFGDVGQVRLSKTVKLTRATSSSPWDSVDLLAGIEAVKCSIKNQGDRSKILKVDLDASNLPIGPFTENISLQFKDNEGGGSSVLTLKVRASIHGPISVKSRIIVTANKPTSEDRTIILEAASPCKISLQSLTDIANQEAFDFGTAKVLTDKLLIPFSPHPTRSVKVGKLLIDVMVDDRPCKVLVPYTIFPQSLPKS